jgi:hypothetical protein
LWKPNAVTNANRDSNCHSDTDGYSNRYSHGHCYVYANTYSYSDVYPNSDGYCYIYSNSHSYGNSYRNRYCDNYTYGNADGDSPTYSDTHCDGTSDAYANSNSGTHARCSDGLECKQCDCEQLHRKLEQRYGCDRLPVGRGYEQFFYQLRIGIQQHGRRPYDQSKRDLFDQEYVLLLPVTRLQSKRHGTQFQRDQGKDQKPLR